MIAEETRSSRSTDLGRWTIRRSTTYFTRGAYRLSATSFWRTFRFLERGALPWSEWRTDEAIAGLPLTVRPSAGRGLGDPPLLVPAAEHRAHQDPADDEAGGRHDPERQQATP